MIIFALAAAVLAQDPYASISNVVALPAPWEHIEVQGWTYAGESADQNMIAFFQPARQRGKVWMRYEYQTRASRSARILAELDCQGWMTRNIQATNFQLSNLQGDSASGTTTSWTDAAPGTFAEKALEFGCGD